MLGYVVRILQLVALAYLWNEIVKYASIFNKFPLVMIALAIITFLSLMSFISGNET